MVRRHGRAAWAGAHVFPGGRVDAADRQTADDRWCDGVAAAATQLADLPPSDAVAHHVAAARELFEEAGVLLARDANRQLVSLNDRSPQRRSQRLSEHRRNVHAGRRSLRDVVEREGLRLALDVLIRYAHWVTPVTEARRFDTRFFITRAPLDQAPAHDEAETTDSFWSRPADALMRARNDEIVLPLPTWTTLRELEGFRLVDEALAWARRRRIRRREPMPIEHAGRQMLVLPGDPLHPDPLREERPVETRFVVVDGRWRPAPAPAENR